MITTLLTPSDTLTPEPPPDIRVRDLIEMLQREDLDAYAMVVTRVACDLEHDGGIGAKGASDEVEHRYCEGIEHRVYNGRKVVVVR